MLKFLAKFGSFKAFRILILSFCLLATIFFSLAFLLLDNPAALKRFQPFIESQLTNTSHYYVFESPYFSFAPDKVQVADTVIRWDEVNKEIVFSARNSKIFDKNNNIIAIVPNINVKFDFLRYLFAKDLAASISLNSAQFFIKTNPNIDTSTRALINSPKENIVNFFKTNLINNNRSYDIYQVKLNNIALNIDNGRSNIKWMLNNGYFLNNKDSISGKIFLESMRKEEIILDLNLKTNNEDGIDVISNISGLTSNIIKDFLPSLVKDNKLKFKVNARTEININKDSYIKDINFEFYDSKFSFILPEVFETEFNIDRFYAKGNFTPKGEELTIQLCEIENNQTKISVSGIFKEIIPPLNLADYAPNLIFDLKIKDLPITDLKYYWPLHVREKIRDWITTRITKGNIKNALASFVITPDDFKLIELHEKTALQNPKKLPYLPLPAKNLINATLNIENADINYFPKYPVAQNVNANVTFDNKAMVIKVPEMNILDSKAKNIEISINNMWLKPSILEIKSDYEGKVEDIINGYLKPTIAKELQENNSKLKSIMAGTGLTNGQVYIALPIKKEALLYDDLNLQVKMNVAQVFLPNFIKNNNITGQNLLLTLNDDQLNIKGTTKLGDLAFTNNYTQFISPSKSHEFISNNKISARITASNINSLAPDLLKDIEIKDAFKFNMEMTENKAGINITGNADFANVEVIMPKYNFHKTKEQKAKLNFSADITDKNLDINYLNLTGDNLNAQTEIKFNKNNKDELTLEYLKLDDIKFAANDFSLSYTKARYGTNLLLYGNNLDLSGISLQEILKGKEPDNSPSHLNINLNNLSMKNNVNFNNFQLQISCQNKLCLKVSAQTKIDNKDDLTANVTNNKDDKNGPPVLVVKTNNAGKLFSALDISNNITGGNLILNSSGSLSNNKVLSKGNMSITNFKAIKTPILGRILTLASLKGYTDILEQEGMSFDKFIVNFSKYNGIITISDATTAGSSIGLTAQGKIDTYKNELDIKGVIVPAQEINRLIGRIPLFGNIINGGKNQGIIATRYVVKGNYKDAKISVNPLSILTPGFLRKIFDVF